MVEYGPDKSSFAVLRTVMNCQAFYTSISFTRNLRTMVQVVLVALKALVGEWPLSKLSNVLPLKVVICPILRNRFICVGGGGSGLQPKVRNQSVTSNGSSVKSGASGAKKGNRRSTVKLKVKKRNQSVIKK